MGVTASPRRYSASARSIRAAVRSPLQGVEGQRLLRPHRQGALGLAPGALDPLLGGEPHGVERLTVSASSAHASAKVESRAMARSSSAAAAGAPCGGGRGRAGTRVVGRKVLRRPLGRVARAGRLPAPRPSASATRAATSPWDANTPRSGASRGGLPLGRGGQDLGPVRLSPAPGWGLPVLLPHGPSPTASTCMAEWANRRWALCGLLGGAAIETGAGHHLQGGEPGEPRRRPRPSRRAPG